ncbi:hypothetical protein [Vibrio maerlii]|uniref:hypothetical protein n=1 Tax=Vibrio maerlii TaxID=2231648 RepID=UPI0013DEC0D1|nr:hypothetical protein [Vibrio maerlii]
MISMELPNTLKVQVEQLSLEQLETLKKEIETKLNEGSQLKKPLSNEELEFINRLFT